jgi:hypothetical protein
MMGYDPELEEDDTEDLDGAPAPVDSLAGPQTPREKVMARISAVRNPSGGDLGGEDAAAGPGSAMDFAKQSAATAGYGRALNAIAGATGYKADNSGYDAMEKRGMDYAQGEANRAARVKAAVQARLGREAAAKASSADRNRMMNENERHNRAMEGLQGDKADQKLGKATADQFKVAGFGKRMRQAEDVFGNLEKSGYSRADLMAGLESNLPSAVQRSQTQQQEQAERNFLNAVLRRESGAAISPAEFDSGAKQYFPRAGDENETLAQKKANRQQVMASLQAESGPAWDKVPGVDTPVNIKKPGSDGLIPEAMAGSGRVTVSNGKETVSIPLSRLPDAMGDGFQVVK